jgi:3-oxoacyl-(acyl-carrier-protein) synthase
MVAADDHGRGAARAMAMALRKASIPPSSVDYLNAHGTGTPLNDLSETRAIRAVFGEHAPQLAISSTKSMLGHMMGAAGAVEAIACVLSIRDGIIPPTINLEQPDPLCDLDYTPGAMRRLRVGVALSNSIGLGGHNSALIFSRLVE